MNVRYRVELSQTERAELTALLSGGKDAVRKDPLRRRALPGLPRSRGTAGVAPVGIPLRPQARQLVGEISLSGAGRAYRPSVARCRFLKLDAVEVQDEQTECR